MEFVQISTPNKSMGIKRTKSARKSCLKNNRNVVKQYVYTSDLKASFLPILNPRSKESKQQIKFDLNCCQSMTARTPCPSPIILCWRQHRPSAATRARSRTSSWQNRVQSALFWWSRWGRRWGEWAGPRLWVARGVGRQDCCGDNNGGETRQKEEEKAV